MKQELSYIVQHSLLLRMWLFLVKPFQITKVLELLYALDWIWYTILAILPAQYVTGVFFNSLYALGLTQPLIIILTATIAIFSWIGLLYNAHNVRKTILLINIGVILYIAFSAASISPIGTSVGYLLILAAMTMFAVWRMDTT